jgi:bifunctional DNase/RNase
LLLTACAAEQKPLVVSPVALAEPAPHVDPVPAAPTPPPVPQGYVRVTIAGVVPTSSGAAVALLDPTRATVLPVYVGGSEATSIQHRFDHTSYVRPLTHDLMDSLMHEVGAEVVRAQIDKLEDGTFYGTLVVKLKSRFVQLDARPSDAVALAMGSGTPIFVSSEVLTLAGVPRDSFEGL